MSETPNALDHFGESRKEAWPEVAGFLVTAAIAIVFRWRAHDLAWSLWLSSLVLGYAFMITSIVRTIRGDGSRVESEETSSSSKKTIEVLVNRSARIAGGIFLLLFFTVHFGGFHAGHAVFLNLFVPLDGSPSFATPDGKVVGFSFNPLDLLAYTPFVLAAAVVERRSFVEDTQGLKNLMKPYANVIRMHLLIFVFAGLSIAEVDNSFLVVAIMAFYFVPWGLLRRRKLTFRA